MLTAITLLVLHANSTDPFVRYKDFTKAHPSMRISFSSTSNGKPAVSGFLLVQRPSNSFYRCQAGQDIYQVSNTEKGYVEVDHADSDYDEFPGGGLQIRSSRISPAADFAPNLALYEDLQRLFKATPKVTPQSDGDQIYYITKGMQGSQEIWLTINQEGALASYRIKSAGMAGVKDRVWNLQYTFPHISPSDFSLPLPLGYQPFALPEEEVPLRKGSTVPVSGWKNASGASVNLLDEAGHKTFLLSILDDQLPSKRALASLRQLKSTMSVEIVGPGMLKDPDGSRTKTLNPPGAPMFYLVDGKGKVIDLWFGFDPEQSAQFQKDILSEAIGTTPSKRS